MCVTSSEQIHIVRQKSVVTPIFLVQKSMWTKSVRSSPKVCVTSNEQIHILRQKSDVTHIFMVQNPIGSNLCDQSNYAIILSNFSNYRVHTNHQKSPKTSDFLTEFDMLISSIGNFRIDSVYE